MNSKIVLVLLVLIAATSCAPSERASCPCGRIYTPVCSSDGNTYNNMCEFECQAKFMKRKYGEEIFVVKHERCDGAY